MNQTMQANGTNNYSSREDISHIEEFPAIPLEFFHHPEYNSKKYWVWEDYVGSYLEYYTDYADVQWYNMQRGVRGMSCRNKLTNQVSHFQYGN